MRTSRAGRNASLEQVRNSSTGEIHWASPEPALATAHLLVARASTRRCTSRPGPVENLVGSTRRASSTAPVDSLSARPARHARQDNSHAAIASRSSVKLPNVQRLCRTLRHRLVHRPRVENRAPAFAYDRSPRSSGAPPRLPADAHASSPIVLSPTMPWSRPLETAVGVSLAYEVAATPRRQRLHADCACGLRATLQVGLLIVEQPMGHRPRTGRDRYRVELASGPSRR